MCVADILDRDAASTFRVKVSKGTLVFKCIEVFGWTDLWGRTRNHSPHISLWVCWTKNLYIHKYSPLLLTSTLKMEAVSKTSAALPPPTWSEHPRAGSTSTPTMNAPLRRFEIGILPEVATCSCSSLHVSLVTTPWRMALDKLMVIHLVKKSPTFHRTSRSITAFTISCSWFISWASWIQFLLFYFFKNHLLSI